MRLKSKFYLYIIGSSCRAMALAMRNRRSLRCLKHLPQIAALWRAITGGYIYLLLSRRSRRAVLRHTGAAGLPRRATYIAAMP